MFSGFAATALRAPQKVLLFSSEVVLCRKMTLNGLLEENLSAVGVKSARSSPPECLLWATAAANVNNASFESSTVYPCK